MEKRATFSILLAFLIAAPAESAKRSAIISLFEWYLNQYLEVYRCVDGEKITIVALPASSWRFVKDVKAEPDWPKDYCLGTVKVANFDSDPVFTKVYRSTKSVPADEKMLVPNGSLKRLKEKDLEGGMTSTKKITEFAASKFAEELNVKPEEIICVTLPYREKIKAGPGATDPQYEQHVAVIMTKDG